MIVPRTRLLVAVAAVFCPASVVLGLLPRYQMAAWLAMGVAVIVAGIDMAVGWRRILGLSVQLPPLLRTAKDRPFDLALTIGHPGWRPRRLRAGLVLPFEFAPSLEVVEEELPRDRAVVASRMAYECQSTRRGQFQVNEARLECASPLGLWAVRRAHDVSCEVRVYPDIRREKDAVAALLNRRQSGIQLQRQVGKGREFEKLRDYLPGDGFDEIHWKASAKRGRLITKVFQIEKTQEVYVVVDASRLSARPSGVHADTMLERFVTAAMVMALATEQQGDLFGLVTFSDRVHQFVRARNGKAHYGACRDALLHLQPERVNPDFDELGTFLRLRLRRRALLLFLTELDDPALAEQFSRTLALLSRQHLVVAGMIQPESAAPLFSGDAASTVDDLYRKLGGHLEWHQLKQLEVVLKQQGIRLALFPAAEVSQRLLMTYRNLKQRQLL